MSMDINTTKPGDKVVYCNPNAGRVCDQQDAVEFLTLGQVYTIAEITVSDWDTGVRLEGIGCVCFSSVMFDNIGLVKLGSLLKGTWFRFSEGDKGPCQVLFSPKHVTSYYCVKHACTGVASISNLVRVISDPVWDKEIQ